MPEEEAKRLRTYLVLSSRRLLLTLVPSHFLPASGNMRNQSSDLRGGSDTDSETSVTICKNGSPETLFVEQLETGLIPYVSFHFYIHQLLI